VLQALRPMTAHDVDTATVRGQYTAGLVEDAPVPGYGDEIDDHASRTETFVALRAEVHNWRWSGVPFYLRTGKRMDRASSEIVVQFKPVPHPMFPDTDADSAPNRLVIRLQPDEGMRLHMTAKEPGPGGIRLRPASLELSYAQTFQRRFPDAYERLLMDVVRGNPTLFMRRDEIEAAWEWVEPILAAWSRAGRAPRRYPAGTSGPAAATTLIERDGRAWHEGQTE
jgi:glucose-6-phosphate 1-dehydrogenase